MAAVRADKSPRAGTLKHFSQHRSKRSADDKLVCNVAEFTAALKIEKTRARSALAAKTTPITRELRSNLLLDLNRTWSPVVSRLTGDRVSGTIKKEFKPWDVPWREMNRREESSRVTCVAISIRFYHLTPADVLNLVSRETIVFHRGNSRDFFVSRLFPIE